MTTIDYVTNIFKDFQPGTLDNINVFLQTVNLHKVLPLQNMSLTSGSSLTLT
jgi:hypothetical protein